MPKPRKADKSTDPNCSFCGTHKDEVPLMVTSNVSRANICSWCALGVVEQTFKYALSIEGQLRELMKPPKIEVVSADNKPDKVDAAIGRALHGKR